MQIQAFGQAVTTYLTVTPVQFQLRFQWSLPTQNCNVLDKALLPFGVRRDPLRFSEVTQLDNTGKTQILSLTVFFPLECITFVSFAKLYLQIPGWCYIKCTCFHLRTHLSAWEQKKCHFFFTDNVQWFFLHRGHRFLEGFGLNFC